MVTCKSSPLTPRGSLRCGCGCGFVFNIILVLQGGSSAVLPGDQPGGQTQRFIAPLPLPLRESINPKALQINVCNNDEYLPGVDHMLGTTPRSLHVLSFDDHDSRVGTVTVPASWEELRQGAQQQHQCHQAPAGSSVPKVPLLLSASPCLPFPSWWFTGHPSPENSSPPFSLKNTLRRIKGPPVSSPFPEGSGV